MLRKGFTIILICSQSLLQVVNNSSIAQISSAEFSQKFADGNLNLLYENIPAAIKTLTELYNADPTNANISYKLGLAYLKSANQKLQSIPYLERAVKNTTKNYMEFSSSETKAPEISFLYMADAYHFNYEFDKAISFYDTYSKLANPKSNLYQKAQYQITVCNFAKELMKAPIQITIKNLGDSINSTFSDYCPLVSANETVMIFTSRRFDEKNADIIENKYVENVYTSYKKGDQWEAAKKISKLSVSSHIAAIGISIDGQQLLLFKDEKGDGNIYKSELFGETWSFPEKIGGDINTKSWERSACFSADGNTIYFSSNRSGGYGGMDIYKSTKLPNGEWSLSTNLGPTVNTIYDEEAPFIHADGVTLFFSSRGHKNIGGFDIFFSNLSNNNTWGEPINIGSPINTTGDDIFFVTSPDNKRAYFSSERKDGMGEKDIYTAYMPDNKEPALTLLKGYIDVKDGDKRILSDVRITATEISNEQLEGIYKPLMRNGSYAIILPPNKNYRIDYKINDSIFHSEKIFIAANTAYNEINKAVDLKSVEIDSSSTAPLLAIAAPIKKAEAQKSAPLETKEKTAQSEPVAKKEKEKTEPIVAKKEKTEEVVVKNEKLVETPTPVSTPGTSIKDGNTFTFVMYPNVSKISTNDGTFEKLMQQVEQLIKEKDKISVVIEASASKVPTKSYANNYVLSRRRATDTKNILSRAFNGRKLEQKISFIEPKSLVQGEEYQGDYKENKMKYDQYQYVKVTIY